MLDITRVQTSTFAFKLTGREIRLSVGSAVFES